MCPTFPPKFAYDVRHANPQWLPLTSKYNTTNPLRTKHGPSYKRTFTRFYTQSITHPPSHLPTLHHTTTTTNMVSLKLQKRLAASVLKCGQRKVWLDPNEANEIALANSRRNVLRLHKDGMLCGVDSFLI